MSARANVALPLVAIAAAYALGSWRLSRRASGSVTTTRIACAGAGLAAIALAVASPLDELAETLFVAHMVQHMLLIIVAAPLLLLADPFPIVLWALPARLRLAAARHLSRRSVAGRAWRAMTGMRATWLVYAAVLWLWHLPLAYEAALADRFVHDLEHVTFFAAAALFWWPVVHPAPRFRGPASHAARTAYLVLGAFQASALGLYLALAPAPLYRAYAIVARPEGFGVLEDQAWGGIVMWALGGLADMLAVLVLVYESFGGVDRPPGGAAGRDPVAASGRAGVS